MLFVQTHRQSKHHHNNDAFGFVIERSFLVTILFCCCLLCLMGISGALDRIIDAVFRLRTLPRV